MMIRSKQTSIKPIFLGVLFLVSMVNVCCGQTKIEKIEALINKYVEAGTFNGSVLVSEKGNIIYKKGFGFANMEWNVPNQSDTKFRLGSITKQFTAMLIMQLVEQGKLKLDVPISTYLPDYPKKNGDIITLHHLLTHTSGIPNVTSFPAYDTEVMQSYHSPAQLVKLSSDSTLEFKPGEKFAYSNSGYMLLGYIIEKLTGKTYRQLLQENIFTPLKMTNTGYDYGETLLKNRASGYMKNGRHYLNAYYINMSVPYAAGAMYSTLEDLYLWDQALYSNQLLRKENMDLLFGKYIPAWGGHYGYGWAIGEIPLGNTSERVQTISHGGGINGFNTQLTRIPSDKSLIVLLDNTALAPLNEMTNAIAAILYDKSYDLPKRSIAYTLADKIEKEGIPATLEYANGIKNFNDYYYADENEMNGMGYEYFQAGKVNEAIAIFKLNTQAFPRSGNTYDSYGEALMASGNKKEALENYTQSIKLNPDNENAIKILKENGINTDKLIKKVSVEYLKLLEGEYVNIEHEDRKVTVDVENGILHGNYRGYRYKLLPLLGEGEFVNPDDGGVLIFNTKNKKSITIVFPGTIKYKKVK
jgi:CubicO group peptidase (beta-lactamase class C family)